jgi:ABC-type phosphate transport system auxiliary subunit
MKLDRLLRKRKPEARKQPSAGTQGHLPISADELTERLETIERELNALRVETKLATQLAYTVEEAAQITRIGINELRERCAMAAGEPLHIKAVHIGRRIVIPRTELLRHLDFQAR